MVDVATVELIASASGSLISLLDQVIKSNSDNATIQKVIDVIEQWLPIIVKAAPDLYAQIMTLVGILLGNSDLDDDQINQLVQIRAQLKAARAAANAAAAAAGEGNAA